MKKLKRLYNQIYFWFNISSSLSCKHCCVNCEFYDSCFKEFTDLESRISPKSYFD